MEGEIASEVRSASRHEQPRIYFKDDGAKENMPSSLEKFGPGRWAGFTWSPRSIIQENWLRLRRAAAATFLPAGYPTSVPDEYLTFQLWNILQDLTSNLRSILCTQKILEGMGVGRAGVTSLAATMQWIARDGASMVGGLAFTALAGSRFGLNIKKWCGTRACPSPRARPHPATRSPRPEAAALWSARRVENCLPPSLSQLAPPAD
jgi:hypothetical protein